MALSPDDLNAITLIVRSEVQPIRDMAKDHDRDLYGEDRRGDGMKDDVKKLNTFKTQVRTMFPIVVVVLQAVWEWGKSKLGGS